MPFIPDSKLDSTPEVLNPNSGEFSLVKFTPRRSHIEKCIEKNSQNAVKISAGPPATSDDNSPLLVGEVSERKTRKENLSKSLGDLDCYKATDPKARAGARNLAARARRVDDGVPDSGPVTANASHLKTLNTKNKSLDLDPEDRKNILKKFLESPNTNQGHLYNPNSRKHNNFKVFGVQERQTGEKLNFQKKAFKSQDQNRPRSPTEAQKIEINFNRNTSFCKMLHGKMGLNRKHFG